MVIAHEWRVQPAHLTEWSEDDVTLALMYLKRKNELEREAIERRDE